MGEEMPASKEDSEQFAHGGDLDFQKDRIGEAGQQSVSAKAHAGLPKTEKTMPETPDSLNGLTEARVADVVDSPLPGAGVLSMLIPNCPSRWSDWSIRQREVIRCRRCVGPARARLNLPGN